MKSLPIIAAGILLAACTKPAPLGPQPVTGNLGTPLNAQQIRAELVGNTGTGTRTGTLTKWKMYVNPDGTLQVTSAQPDETGAWRISDDGKFCMKLKMFDGQDTCHTVYKNGATIQLSSARSLSEMVFAPGKAL